jgi:hypothetical protein
MVQSLPSTGFHVHIDRIEFLSNFFTDWVSHFLLETTLVIACRITTPAFSISFFDNPIVTQTLSAGCGCHPWSRALASEDAGNRFSLVMRTPLARACVGLGKSSNQPKDQIPIHIR